MPRHSSFVTWVWVVVADGFLFAWLFPLLGVVFSLLLCLGLLVAFAILADGIRGAVRCPQCGKEAAHVAGRAWMCTDCGSWVKGPDFEI